MRGRISCHSLSHDAIGELVLLFADRRVTLVLNLFFLLRRLKEVVRLGRCSGGLDWRRFLLRLCSGGNAVVNAELELFSVLEVRILNVDIDPFLCVDVENHLDAADFVREGRARNLNFQLRLVIMGMEGQLGVEILHLFRVDLILSLAVDGDRLEDLERAAHVVDAAEANSLGHTLGLELQLGVSPEPELGNIEAELLH